MKISNPKFLFLDIGGVLLSNGWGHESRQKAAQKFGLNFAEMDVLHHFIFNVYEMGRINLDEYLDTVVFNHPRDFTKEDFRKFMFAQSIELPDMLSWLKDWKKHSSFRIISLNNEGKELNDYRIRQFELHACFDAFVSSCDVGMRKPDPRIYTLAMGIAHAIPAQCIYFDDRAMLVESARRQGMKAFHHESYAHTRKLLENMSL